MEELLTNANEFIESGEENLKKKRFNVAASDFFKAIVIFCDYLIYKEIKILPKNHTQRFYLLNRHNKEVYKNVSDLFKLYIRSYNSRLNEEEAIKIKEYANKLKYSTNNK